MQCVIFIALFFRVFITDRWDLRFTSSSKLQRVQNAATKLHLKQSKFNQIVSLLFQLSTAKSSRIFFYALKQYIL